MRKLIGAAALAATLLAVTAPAALGGEDPVGWRKTKITHEASPRGLTAGVRIRQHQSGGGGSGGGGGGAHTPPMGGVCALSAVIPGIAQICAANALVAGQSTPGQPTVQPIDMARELLKTMTLPKPGIGMNPRPGDRHLVNMPGGSWLWIDEDSWHPVTASVSSGGRAEQGHTVSVTATPVTVGWDLQDGPSSGHVNCYGPGTPYDTGLPPDAKSDCSYQFQHAATADSVTATITWQITWTVTQHLWTGDIQGAGTLPDLTTSGSVTARVEQVQSVNAA
jgi:hypothetical protein